MTLTGAEGGTYLDLASGAMVASLGYGHPEIIEAMVAQARTLSYVHNGRYTHDAQERLAERLPDLLGGGYAVYLCSSGSEAIEAAMRIAYACQVARGEPSRKHFISSPCSFHGCSLGALSITGFERIRSVYDALLPESRRIFRCHCQFSSGAATCGDRCACVEGVRWAGFATDTAALVIESMSSNGLGALTLPDGVITSLIDDADRSGSLVILDEISTSLGRTGRDFYFQHQTDRRPHLICLSKGLGVGYANIGAVLVRNDVADQIRASGLPLLGHAYNAHPVACAVANAVLDIMAREKYADVARVRGIALSATVRDRLASNPFFNGLRGLGLLQAIHIGIDGKPFPATSRVSERMYDALLAQGFVVLPGRGGHDGTSGDHVTLCPSFLVQEQHFMQFADALDTALYDVCGPLSAKPECAATTGQKY